MKARHYLIITTFSVTSALGMENAMQCPLLRPISLADVIEIRLKGASTIVTPEEQNNRNKALAHACARGVLHEVFTQLQKGADPSAIPLYDADEHYLIPAIGRPPSEWEGNRLASERYGFDTPLLLAATFQRKEVAEKLIEFQKKLNEVAMVSMCVLLRFKGDGPGGNNTLVKVLLPYLKPYAHNLYREIGSMLNAGTSDGKKACQLLPIPSLLPNDISVKDWFLFKYKQAEYQYENVMQERPQIRDVHLMGFFITVGIILPAGLIFNALF